MLLDYTPYEIKGKLKTEIILILQLFKEFPNSNFKCS